MVTSPRTWPGCRALGFAFGLGGTLLTIGPATAEEAPPAKAHVHVEAPGHAGELALGEDLPRSQEPEGDALDISVLTFGPGDHAFSKFGHDGILVTDRERGTSLVYNYGTFSFHSYWLIPQFLLGKYRYWLSVAPLSSVVRSYSAENRSIVLQHLALSAREKRDLAAFLTWNAREENKYYEYDYYRDNCATRIRDVIDRATGGAMRPTMTLPAQQTWRAHTERLTAGDLAVYLGLDLAMGPFIDQPISVWSEMFLPDKLRETLARTTVDPDGRAPHKLVDAEEVISSSSRPPPLRAPPEWTLRFLALGAGLGLILAALGGALRRGVRGARVCLGTLLGVAGFALGAQGSILAALWIFTNHEVAYRNENLLQTSPLALLLGWAGARLAFGKPGALEGAHAMARLLVISSSVGLALKAMPLFSQKNGPFIALLLPLWTGAAIATWLVGRARANHDGAVAHELRGVE